MRTSNPSAGKQLQATQRPPLTEVFGALPATIKIGETKSVKIIGYNLTPADRLPPVVTIRGQEVPVVLSTNASIVANVAELDVQNGSTGLVISYQSTITSTDVLTVETSVLITRAEDPQAKADLEITDFRLEPENPIIQDQVVKALVTVRNRGTAPASFFSVTWRPDAATPVGPIRPLDGLAPGQSETFVFNQAYPITGTFETVAEVDPFNDVGETDETNNLSKKNVTVVTPSNPIPTTGPIVDPDLTEEPDPCTRVRRPPLYKCNLMPELSGCDC